MVVVVRKPYLIQMLRLTLKSFQTSTSLEMTIIMYLCRDDECFNLWNASNLRFWGEIWLFVCYFGSVIFYQFYNLLHIGYCNINKKSYQYISMQIVWQYFHIILSIKNTYIGFMVSAGYCPILIHMKKITSK